MEKEKKFYYNVINKKYGENCKKPYILDGFKYIEGTWDLGFVVEDEKQNQFVWVPTSNEIENAQNLVKINFFNIPTIPKDDCLDDNYETFIKSALENGGFYISRFETGIEDGEVVSKKNSKLLYGLSKQELLEKIKKLNYKDEFECELINGFAYDTTLEWIKKSNNIETFKYGNDEVLTGRNQVNNIYDLFDDIFEYTLETSFDTNIIRGVLEKDFLYDESRYSILKDENNFDFHKIGARLIIYK
ncbi:MAG: hypothetical protein IKM97_04455 [Clostridia bacterium]|nr:hypothetical protein [Clostridia bacterium]